MLDTWANTLKMIATLVLFAIVFGAVAIALLAVVPIPSGWGYGIGLIGGTAAVIAAEAAAFVAWDRIDARRYRR